MRRAILLLAIISLLAVALPARFSFARDEKESASDRVLVSIELPPDFELLSERKLKSRLEDIIPGGFLIEEINRETVVLSGLRSRLPEFEGSGLEIDRINSVSRGSKQAGRLSLFPDLAFKQNWGPLTYPGEIITDIFIDSLSGEEDAVVVGTRNSDWSQGKTYYYDWQGNLIWSATFPRGVDNLYDLDLDDSGNEGILSVTRNSGNTEGGVYVHNRGGMLLGSWTSSSCGIDDVDIYDLDDDGSDEIIIEPEDYDTFYVLDHNGNLEWLGTVTDNITSISYPDLYGNGQYELVVFSRDKTIPRGHISSFHCLGALLGTHDYTASDLAGTYAPSSASFEDLNGDGFEEIIPYPSYLNQKLEILSYMCLILDTENLGRDIDSYKVSYDFNGDGNLDIVLMTTTDTPDTLKIQGFLGFNGSGFDATWSYPAIDTIDKDAAEWDMDESGIAFGTEISPFSAGRVYLLNGSDGTEWAPSVDISGSVEDLEYQDMDNDGTNEVVILTDSYSAPTHTWTFYVYDHNLNLLAPSGHFSYQSSTGSEYAYNYFSARDMNGDDVYELIPYYRYLGSIFPLIDYTGVLKWSYSAPGPINDLDYFYDINGDGNSNLGVIAATGGGGHIAFLKDNGASYGTIGMRIFSDEVDYVSYRSFIGYSGREIMPYFENSLNTSLYSRDLSHCFWSFTPSGDEIVYRGDTDIDEDDVDDIYIATNDTTTTTGYLYVFFGIELPSNPVLSSGDYDGDGTSDIAVFRGETGLWAVRDMTRAYFGGSSDIPVPGDYNGDGTSDIGIYRGETGLWAIRGVTRSYFGSASDTVIPGDYNGDGHCDAGIFRESSGLWAIRGITRAYFGTTSDAPVPGDYNGDGTLDFGVYRGSSCLWALRGMSRVYFGSELDVPIPGDYNGNGSERIAIFRPYSGLWAIREVTRIYFGKNSDQPVPADYSGNNSDDIGIFRGKSSSGLWAIREITRAYYGSTDYLPVTR